MDALWTDIPETILEERSQHGKDKRDECWDGVLHMVPPPSSIHERVMLDLSAALDLIAKRRGWRAWTAGLFEHETSWRVPDISVARPEHVSARGLDGAELVVEVLSPNDRSREKFEFYARVGVREIWLIDPKTRAIEIYALVGAAYRELALGTSPVLDVALEVLEGPALRLRDGDATYEI